MEPLVSNNLTTWIVGGGLATLLTFLAGALATYLKYRADNQTTRTDHETEARKMVDEQARLMFQTLTARVDTVEKENVNIRDRWHECEEKHSVVSTAVAVLSEQHKNCAEENAEMCQRITELEAKVA